MESSVKTAYIIILTLAFSGFASSSNLLEKDPLWTSTPGGRINSITALNNTLLVASDTGLHSLDYNKVYRWRYPTKSPVTAVHLSGNRIIASTQDGQIILMDLDGRIIWERTIPGYVGFDQAIDSNEDMIILGAMDGFVYALHWDGFYNWKRLVGTYVQDVRAYDDRIISVSDRQVYLLDTNSTVRMNLNIIGFIRSSAIGSETISIGLDDGALYNYCKDGYLNYRLNLAQYISSIDEGQDLIIGTREGTLIRIDDTGGIIWSANLSAAAVEVKTDGENILASTVDGRVTLFDSDGNVRWHLTTDDRPEKITLFGRNIAAATGEGRIILLRITERNVTDSIMMGAALIVIIISALLVVKSSWK
jgi:hypothetical protein